MYCSSGLSVELDLTPSQKQCFVLSASCIKAEYHKVPNMRMRHFEEKFLLVCRKVPVLIVWYVVEADVGRVI
jgi:hypothetical protein